MKTTCKIKQLKCIYSKKEQRTYLDLAKHKLKCKHLLKNNFESTSVIAKHKCAFALKIKLKASLKTARNNKKPTFTCKTCFKLFRSKKLLIDHQNSVHSNIKCRKCGLFFKNRSQIQVHHLIQHGGQGNLQEIPWTEENSPISGDVALAQEYNFKKVIF